MIDEKKLIEKIWNIFSETYNNAFNFDEDESKLVERVMIDVQNAIEEQPKICGWIPCSERLPEEKINPVTKDFYEYQVTFQSDDVADVRHYNFGKGHWWNGPGIMDEYVTAWREPLEAYHG